MVRRCISTVLPIGYFWKNRTPQTEEHMFEVKRINAPSDIPAEGKLCLDAVRTVRDGPKTSERPNSHGAGWQAGQGEAWRICRSGRDREKPCGNQTFPDRLRDR